MHGGQQRGHATRSCHYDRVTESNQLHVLLSEAHSTYAAALRRLPARVTTVMRWPHAHLLETTGSSHRVITTGSRLVPVDVVILQSLTELDDWVAQRTFHGLEFDDGATCVFLEHDPPRDLTAPVHPASGMKDVSVVVHVTEHNRLLWQTAGVPSTVVEHGVPTPRPQYTGEAQRATVVINEPLAREWAVGWDIVQELRARGLPVDLVGGGTEFLDGMGYLPQDDLHRRMAAGAVYLHPFRWTSLGLTLIEAMHMGIPVVALGTGAVPDVLQTGGGVATQDVNGLFDQCRQLLDDEARAREIGDAGRAAAAQRFGLDRFLRGWMSVLDTVTARSRRRRV